jgi:orotate phosphoribosyltransferase
VEESILQIFERTGSLLNGHFILSSGLHSRQFFQCALVLQYADLASTICEQLAAKLADVPCDTVISPALGGIIVGQEVARHLSKRHIFAEKQDGKLVLRRGFQIQSDERFIVAEDVVTRGGKVLETMEIVRSHGGKVMAVGSIVDRSGQDKPNFGCRFESLLQLQVETFAPDNLPPDLRDIPAIKPGSR